MKSNWIIGGVLLVIVIVAGALVYKYKTPTENIVGCYQMNNGKDVYTLNIISQKGKNVTGRMVFKNFEKDSSQGDLVGTYNGKDRILLGTYSFSSEGMNSVIQVTFRKSGDTFIRGFGPVDPSGTKFLDLNNIKYDSADPMEVFAKTTSTCPTGF